MVLPIAVNGAAGRMGQRLVALASQDSDLQLVAALEFSGHPRLGDDAGLVAGVEKADLPLTEKLDVEVGAVIDFSVPEAAEQVTRTCQQQKLPLVMATTGLDDQQKQLLQEASTEIPIVWAPNMSLAVNLAMKLSVMAGEVLKQVPAGVDVDIIEQHHRYKQDAPSGTALRFGQLIAGVMGQSGHVHGREGITGERSQDEIGYHALRVGDHPGEHTIVFGMPGETIELTVRATSRDCYALGALQAAKFVVDQPPGIYSMEDVLGL